MSLYIRVFAVLISFPGAISHAQVNEMGQRLSTYINNKLDSLRAAGVDSILLFSQEFTGMRGKIDDSCGISDPHYLVWQFAGKVYYQYILEDALSVDYCYTPNIHHPRSTVFSILSENATKIQHERLQPFVAKIEWEGQVYYQPLWTSHPTYYRLWFYWKRTDVIRENQDHPAMSKVTTSIDLKENSYDGRVVNLNYPYNHNSGTMLLMNRIMAEIEELNLDQYLRKSHNQQARPTAAVAEGSLVKALKAKGADSILSFSMITAGGGFITEDSFQKCFTPNYFIWKADGKTCLQKYIDCIIDSGENILPLASLPVCIDSSLVHHYISKNFESIVDSEIFPVILKINRNGQQFHYTYSSSHPTYYKLDMYSKDTVISLEVNSEHVRKDYSIRNANGTVMEYIENANYGWNNSTALWKLMEMIERQVSLLEERKQFKYKKPFP